MKVNGEKVTWKPETTLLKFLEENDFNITKIAVERNGEIVPKTDYGQIILTEADTLEVVSFVGGG